MNYEEMIRNAMTGGVTPEDIAKSFTEALNKVQKEADATSARRDKIDEIENHFIRCMEKECFEADNIGELAVLIYAAQHPEWTAEDIDKYKDAITETARVSSRIIGVQDEDKLFGIIEEELTDAITKAMNATTAAVGNKATDTKSDDEVALLRFLSKLQ